MTEPEPLTGHDLVRRHTIHAAVVGSRAFGLAIETSDTDVRGVYVAPTESFWGFAKPPVHVDGPEPEWFSWEVERFCGLALKCDPNMLEMLSSPLPLISSELGEELLQLRSAFVSRVAYQTYNGYAISQFAKVEADLRRDGVPRWKHVMHLLRLLLEADELLRTGELSVDVGADRERLLAVRRGELSWQQAATWRANLHRRVDTALETTRLPAGPDQARVERWLVSVRRRSLRGTECD